MGNNKIIIPTEKWVELYGELSNFILEYSSLDPIWTIDDEGNEVRTEDKQDEFMDIVDDVENIMRLCGFVKQGENNGI
tara:strand:- start:173 stop:406 length:234 start_codon:yes stop_codon:yes gene_type:complete